MDGGMVMEQPTGLYGWILEYGQVVAFVAQIAYWLLMIVLLAYAVWQYKRWVNFQLGVGKSGKLRLEQESGAAAGSKTRDTEDAEEDAPAIEEFVD